MRFLSGQHRRSYGNPVKTAKTTEREPTLCGLGSLLVVLQPCHERQYRCVDGKRQQAEARYAFHDPHSIPPLQSVGGCAMIQTTALWWLLLQAPYLALVGVGKGLFSCQHKTVGFGRVGELSVKVGKRDLKRLAVKAGGLHRLPGCLPVVTGDRVHALAAISRLIVSVMVLISAAISSAMRRSSRSSLTLWFNSVLLMFYLLWIVTCSGDRTLSLL